MDDLRENVLGTKSKPQSLRHYTIEETYELETILDNDLVEVKELGDLMLHLVFMLR
jgi:uncharacterized protein YabN with tetrapyrrole methylase and pyrophosphatase domain